MWFVAAVFRQEFVLVFSGKVAQNRIRSNEIKKKVRKSMIFRQGRYVHKIALTSRAEDGPVIVKGHGRAGNIEL